MGNPQGYARVLARVRIEGQLNKSLFGKPYLKYGQLYVMGGYFAQLGGILGAKHSANLDAFGDALMAVSGPPGAMKKYFTEIAKALVEGSPLDSITFTDLVGDSQNLLQHGMEKVDPGTAEELIWQYSIQGAALGSLYPERIRSIFERTHKRVPKEEWERAHSAGLNIPKEQDVMSYEEVEEAEDEVFMRYCQECRPDLYPVLSGSGVKQADLAPDIA